MRIGTLLAFTSAVTAASLRGQAPLLDSLRVGSVEVRLEETSLDSVARALSLGQVRESGDAGGYEAALCYALPDSSGFAVLRLVSTELGGPNRAVMQFSMKSDRTAPASAHCPLLRHTEVHLPRGLRLGLGRADVIRLFGKPTSAIRQTLVYETRTEAGEWPTIAHLELLMRDDRVVSIYGSRSTTN